MKTIRLIWILAVFLFGASVALAQASMAGLTNGAIVEQHRYELPTWEMLVDEWKTTFPRETVERIRKSPTLELLKITYLSDGLKIVGFIYKPKRTTGKRLPAIIFNRGRAER